MVNKRFLPLIVIFLSVFNLFIAEEQKESFVINKKEKTCKRPRDLKKAIAQDLADIIKLKDKAINKLVKIGKKSFSVLEDLAGEDNDAQINKMSSEQLQKYCQKIKNLKTTLIQEVKKLEDELNFLINKV